MTSVALHNKVFQYFILSAKINFKQAVTQSKFLVKKELLKETFTMSDSDFIHWTISLYIAWYLCNVPYSRVVLRGLVI